MKQSTDDLTRAEIDLGVPSNCILPANAIVVAAPGNGPAIPPRSDR